MMRNELKWLLTVVLAGTFAAAPASFARGQSGPEAVNNRVDRRQDRRALRHDERKIDRRQVKLHSDVRQFGPQSPQARADRRQLRHVRHQFRRQARDLRQDRREARSH
ncbi:MAG TPA: hypothetical protein VGW37_12275 [Terriglobia bacterium]|nr:hypothetical protein [Terriglobia bacterium]